MTRGYEETAAGHPASWVACLGPRVGRVQGPFSLSPKPPSRGTRGPNRGSSNAVLSRVGFVTQDWPPGSLPVAVDGPGAVPGRVLGTWQLPGMG